MHMNVTDCQMALDFSSMVLGRIFFDIQLVSAMKLHAYSRKNDPQTSGRPPIFANEFSGLCVGDIQVEVVYSILFKTVNSYRVAVVHEHTCYLQQEMLSFVLL